MTIQEQSLLREGNLGGKDLKPICYCEYRRDVEDARINFRMMQALAHAGIKRIFYARRLKALEISREQRGEGEGSGEGEEGEESEGGWVAPVIHIDFKKRSRVD